VREDHSPLFTAVKSTLLLQDFALPSGDTGEKNPDNLDINKAVVGTFLNYEDFVNKIFTLF
jgi:hypothetical protein